jgi:isocitrate/isopropylmalate dehydrogenase
MFEPIHGSAPKYAGKGLANPIGQILAGKMMLEWLGERYRDQKASLAAERIETGVTEILAEKKTITSDLGGTSKTNEVGDAVANRIKDVS